MELNAAFIKEELNVAIAAQDRVTCGNGII
jgi:hypothetical protein